MADSTTETLTTTAISETPAGPTFLTNAGFEDSSLGPWVRAIEDSTVLSIDSVIKHDGKQSCRIDWPEIEDPIFNPTQYNYIIQPLPQTPEANVPYAMSTWVRVSAQEDGNASCQSSFIRCTYRENWVVADTAIQPNPNQWQKMSTSCTYTQEQINTGGLYLYIGFSCGGSTQSWVDTASFEPLQ